MLETARDVMQTHVVALSPDDPMHVAQRLFYEEGIHGAPVIDDDGAVLGMLSSTDILRALTEAKEVAPVDPVAYENDLDTSHDAWGIAPEDFKLRVRDAIVSDYMTEGLVHVAPEMPVSALARTMRENQIHRVLVLEDGNVRGIVSTFDLIQLIESRG